MIKSGAQNLTAPSTETDYLINAYYLMKLNLRRIRYTFQKKVRKAIYYAKKCHGDQKRQSGEPYYSHP